ncbi:hypothetical protein HanPI659440_Chr00c07g0718201 [Helianthus annuus]|nr:hypothetical protein HanPI659440_Chr00c07g0718201 [Helianthus annuus]
MITDKSCVILIPDILLGIGGKKKKKKKNCFSYICCPFSPLHSPHPLSLLHSIYTQKHTQ